MKTLRLAVASAVVAACALFALAGPAAAYPDATCSITDPGRACAGNTLTLTAAVDGLPAGASCSPISITWKGVTRTGTGTTLAAQFPTSAADIGTSSDLASCTYVDSQTGTKTVSTSGTVIVTDCTTAGPDDEGTSEGSDGSDSDSDSDSDSSDSDSDASGILPNTGGERLLWLIIGLVLVVGGATVVIRSRRSEDGTSN